MFMLMMEFGHMTVGVGDCRVCVLVAVLADNRFGVEMVMVAVVMAVPMFMGFLDMDMWMGMFFGDSEIRSGEHDRQCSQEGTGDRVAEHDPGNQDADKGSCGVINTGSCCAEFPLGCDIEEDAEAIGNEA
jgi:hypothetical protein